MRVLLMCNFTGPREADCCLYMDPNGHLMTSMYNLKRHALCAGGIIGLGEAEEDRVGLLHTLATLPAHPESVPINALVAVKGTPLQDQKVFRTAD